MNQRLVVTSALASVLASTLTFGFAATASAQDKGKEKCYGIAKAGANDCANLSGSHSCAGQAKADGSADDWKYVATGTCKDMNGTTADEAKKKMDSMKKS